MVDFAAKTAVNQASSNLVVVRTPLATLNSELSKLSEPACLALIERGKSLAAVLATAEVVDEEDYAAVLERCKQAKGVEDDLDAVFEPFVDASNALHKGFIRWRDHGAGVNELENARKAAARKAGQWQQAEQEKQRQRLLAEQTERERAADVQRMLELEELEASGQGEAAAELAAVPVAPVPAAAAPEPVAPKVKGAAYVEQWTYRITNPDLVPDEFWVIDEKRIAARVRSLKGDTRIPGVDVWPEGTVRTGAV